MTGTWDATQPRRDSLGEVLHRQAVGLVPCSNSSPKAEPQPRTPINPAIMELLGELAMRFPKGDNGDGDKLRLRLLAEDLSETMTPAALAAAIKEGRKSWRFLPTLAEIFAAAEPYRAEQRDKAREAALWADGAERRALALQPPCTFDSGAILAEAHAKIEAGTAALLGYGDETAPIEPLTWRAMRESGQVVSSKLRALWAEQASA